ncbi:hypothetical protein SSYIS1_11810 [Serratia symbiotica]|uniref:Uncharacterized protein n=1 Tax=Serratia symbiotica TaxID=138074 RepID=A0A455VRV6_9GAMM|nr:hypothetical protein SSYIS1_11810 [Serratia symbiotica]
MAIVHPLIPIMASVNPWYFNLPMGENVKFIGGLDIQK